MSHYKWPENKVSSFFLASHPRRDYHEKNARSFLAARLVNGKWLMVMGFNTDVECRGVVYHIQTELRKSNVIESSVYVRGAIIHCLKTDCQDLASLPDATQQEWGRRLEDQHRQVVRRIRAGEIRNPMTSGISSTGI